MQNVFVQIKNKDVNLNTFIRLARTNIYVSSKHKKNIQSIIRPQLKKLKPIKTPCKVVAIWHIKKRNVDLDNLSLKYFLDVLQDMGLLENDNAKHIIEIKHKFEYKKEVEGVHLYFLEGGQDD